MDILDKVFEAWETAEAFIVDGELYEKTHMGSPDDDSEPVMTLERYTKDGLLYEIEVTDDMVQYGAFIDKFHTFRTIDSNEVVTDIMPLYVAGVKTREMGQ